MAKKDDDRPQLIIIKRPKKGGGAHHGGAWKVAYADFVTAMMAFFLLLWLLNVTTDEQKKMISSYFAPADPRISEETSGAGGVMGGTTMAPEGAMTSDKQPVVAMQRDPAEGIGRADESGDERKRASEEEIEKELERRDKKAFAETEEKIRQAVESSPDLKEFAPNLLMDMTPEGLRIQIIDQEGKPMFELGSAKPLPQAEKLLGMISKVVMDLPNKISIRGHTDSKPYGKDASYTNWELSADRANASRRVMLFSGLDITRIENVQGKADREHLRPDDPQNASNRRISIILLKQALTRKPGEGKGSGSSKKGPEKIEPKKQEQGVIYFP